MTAGETLSWAAGAPRHGGVVAGNADAVQAGVAILAAGGNGFDAIVATAYAMGVVEPLDNGIGGGGFATLYDAKSGQTLALDFIGAAPRAAHYQLYHTHSPVNGYQITVRGRENECGHRSVAVPGAVAGLSAILDRFGSLPLSEVLQPAITLAEQGFKIAHKPALRLARTEATLRISDETIRVLLNPDGSLPAVGTPMRNPDYGDSLRQLASKGPACFYQGDLGARICADMVANDGFLDANDLANYQARWRAPSWGRFAGRQFATMAPPSAGQLVLKGLNALENQATGNRLYQRAQAMLAMFEQRGTAIGDPAFIPPPRKAGESAETTSLAAIDKDGNAACITYSLNIHSGIVSPGTGILLNNQMLLFDPWPGGRNAIIGGKRPTSSMMPTLAFNDNGVELAIGASGSTRIPTALMQVIDQLMVGGLALEDAIGAGRIHAEAAQLLADADMAETAKAIACDLGLDYQLLAGRDPSMGAVQAIYRNPENGHLKAAGDPRAGASGRVS
jgi:gamma-glutamyltranspeptidase/glutathione hydrolase